MCVRTAQRSGQAHLVVADSDLPSAATAPLLPHHHSRPPGARKAGVLRVARHLSGEGQAAQGPDMKGLSCWLPSLGRLLRGRRQEAAAAASCTKWLLWRGGCAFGVGQLPLTACKALKRGRRLFASLRAARGSPRHAVPHRTSSGLPCWQPRGRSLPGAAAIALLRLPSPT